MAGSLTFRWSCCLIGGASGTIHGTAVALVILAHLKHGQQLVMNFHQYIHRAATLGPLGGDPAIVTATTEPSLVEDVDFLTLNLKHCLVKDVDRGTDLLMRQCQIGRRRQTSTAASTTKWDLGRRHRPLHQSGSRRCSGCRLLRRRRERTRTPTRGVNRRF